MQTKKKILFLSYHAGIWQHAFPEDIVLRELKNQGHEVQKLVCDAVLSSHCSVMTTYGVSVQSALKERLDVCKKCQSKQRLLNNWNRQDVIPFSSLLTPEQRKEAADLSQNLAQEQLVDYEYQGLPVGKYSLYEPLLNFKKSALQFSDEELPSLRASFENTLLSAMASLKYLKTNKPDIMVCYNSAYSVNHIFAEAMTRAGVRVINLHAGLHFKSFFRTMLVATNSSLDFINTAKSEFEKFSDIPLSADQIDYVMEHFDVLTTGKSVFAYSDPSQKNNLDVRDKLGIPKDKKLVVAALSSYDERFGAETIGILPRYQDLIFPVQADWIRELIEWAKKNPQVTLLIRPHPRELPNKREGVKSGHAVQLEKTLTNLPENVKVNWPADNVSLYDLALVTDVFASAWSSVGVEMSMYGSPVVLYSKDLPLYPLSLNEIGNNVPDYFEKIEKALNQPFDFERIRQTLRWLYFYYSAMTVNLEPACRLNVRQQRPFHEKVLHKFDYVAGTNISERLDLLRANVKIQDTELLLKWMFDDHPPLEEIKLQKYKKCTTQQETKAIARALSAWLHRMGVDKADNLPRIQILKQAITQALSL